MNIFNETDWDAPAIKWLSDRLSVAQRRAVYPEIVISMAIGRMAETYGLLMFSPLHVAKTPYDCTIAQMEEIYEAGYDLEIKGGLLCGWKARVKE